MEISQSGLILIKAYEGLRLEAYPDPGTGGEPWTIGYGHTGGVRKGQVISVSDAEQLLSMDLERFERAVSRLITVALAQNEFDALVSFAFNVGIGALEDSTLRKRLNAGEPKAKVFKEELPRWNKGGSGVMEGLVRRRAAEVKLATAKVTAQVAEQVPAQVSFLEKAATHYVAEPHQTAAYRWLESVLDPKTLEQFKARYRGEMVEHTPIIATFPLDVPYFYQRDSRTGHGERSCFSSAMAMAIEYLDPEAIRDDDDYLSVVFRYGDTVSSDAQVKAAHSLGVPVEFHSDGTQAMLEQLLDEGIPVPIGILHKGSINRPTGGGHWITLIGYDETHFMAHDPYGELDLINGGYPKAGPNDGKNQRYSKKNLMKRWLIANDHDGWLMAFD